jgi:nitrous oxidase accessory protein NosD
MRNRALGFALALSIVALPTFAQATRTWVSGVGDDFNPCSRTAPCKTFAGAISRTAPGGEINVLDAGGFGTVTITKSIRIDGTPFISGVLSSGVNGIIVNAATTDKIVLRNLDINGNVPFTAAVTRGIRVMQAGSIIIQDCEIYNFGERGISIEGTSPTQTHILNSRVYNNPAANGIVILPSAGAVAHKTTIENTSVFNNGVRGIYASNGSTTTVLRSTISGNATGINAEANSGTTVVNVYDTSVDENGTGLQTNGSVNAFIRIGHSTVQNNTTAGFTISAGQILSYGDNYIQGNGANTGALSGTGKS